MSPLTVAPWCKLLILLAGLFHFDAAKGAFVPDSLPKRCFSILPVPALGHSPETGTYLGVVSLFSYRFSRDSLTRASNAKFEFNYTFKNQYISELAWDIFTRQERYFYSGKVHYARYPDFYWGIGEASAESDKTAFNSRRFVLEINALKSISRQDLFAGIILKRSVYSRLGESPLSFPELRGSSSHGLGLRLMQDKRNSLLNSTSGHSVDVSFLACRSGEKDYQTGMIDLRVFRTLREVHTLGLRAFAVATAGEAPFYDLACLGGDRQVRGIYQGRYRDNCLAGLQAEYRTLVYKRWGYAVFGGLSNVSNRPETLGIKLVKVNYGAGLRFLIDRAANIQLRVDYAMANDGSSGIYIAFGEAF